MKMGVVSVYSRIPNLFNELRNVLPNVAFHQVTSDADETLKQSEIIIADYPLIGPHLYDLKKVKWYQGTWAGLDKLMPFINPQQPPTFTMSRYSGRVFGQIMSEYIIAYITNYERDAFAIYDNQKMKKWDVTGKKQNYRTISSLNIGILGVGQIGTFVAEALSLLGAHVMGMGRKPTLNSAKTHFQEYFTNDNLPQLLQKSDYVINTLPTTPETTGLLNGNVLQNCQAKSSVFINVGRGSVIGESDLLHALQQKWISAAILDVFQQEPLPESSPLWTTEGVIITPHNSATSFARDIAKHFKESYELYCKGEPIPATIDFTVGY